jgi:hypothetical protein
MSRDPNWILLRVFSSLNGDNAYVNSMTWDESGLTDLSYDARIDYELSFSLFENFNGKRRVIK